MPVNKDALIRYRVINRLLRNKQNQFPTLEELRLACEDALDQSVSKRTLQADLEAMRYDKQLGYNAPIKYFPNEKGYGYDPSEYSIDNIPLSSEDHHALEFALKILDQFKGIQLFEPITGAIDKINNSLTLNRHLYKEKEDYIEIEKAPEYLGQEFLAPLADSIEEQKLVNLEYSSFKDNKKKEHAFAPLLLKEYRNRWYVIGYHVKKDAINTFALDRILGVSKTNKFRPKKLNFNPKDYFKYSFGITADNSAKPKTIILECDPVQGSYIKSQPLHGSQKVISDDEEKTTIQLEVIPSFELISTILSYGTSVKVLKPKSLAKIIRDEGKKMNKMYGSL